MNQQERDDYSYSAVERNRRMHERAMRLRERTEDATPGDTITPTGNAEAQLNWGAQATAMPVISPAAVPEMPFRPLIPDAPQPGALSGVDAIVDFTNRRGGR